MVLPQGRAFTTLSRRLKNIRNLDDEKYVRNELTIEDEI